MGKYIATSTDLANRYEFVIHLETSSQIPEAVMEVLKYEHHTSGITLKLIYSDNLPEYVAQATVKAEQ